MDKETAKTSAAEEKKRGIDSTVLIAIISGLVTLIVALLGFPPLIAYLTPAPTLTPSITPFFTEISPTIPTDLTPPTATLTPTIIQVASETPLLPGMTDTPTPSLSTMFVRASANRTDGRAPLLVKFRATDSYVVAPDGTIFYCSNGACHYTWFVYLSGTQVGKSDTTKIGTFDYKFDRTGTYLVNVNVCHGAENPTCNIGSILVFIE